MACVDRDAANPNGLDFSCIEFPFLSISVINSDNKHVEAVQDLLYPAFVTSTVIWWGCTWHMRSPLDLLPSGSVVIVRLKCKDRSSHMMGAVKDLLWAIYPIERTTIDTGAIKFQISKSNVPKVAQQTSTTTNTTSIDLSPSTNSAAGRSPPSNSPFLDVSDSEIRATSILSQYPNKRSSRHQLDEFGIHDGFFSPLDRGEVPMMDNPLASALTPNTGDFFMASRKTNQLSFERDL